MGNLEHILFLIEDLENKIEYIRQDEKLYYDQSVIIKVATDILNAKQGMIRAIQIKDQIIEDMKRRIG